MYSNQQQQQQQQNQHQPNQQFGWSHTPVTSSSHPVVQQQNQIQIQHQHQQQLVRQHTVGPSVGWAQPFPLTTTNNYIDTTSVTESSGPLRGRAMTTGSVGMNHGDHINEDDVDSENLHLKFQTGVTFQSQGDDDDAIVDESEQENVRKEVDVLRERVAHKRALNLLDYAVTGKCKQESLMSSMKYNEFTLKLKKIYNFEKKRKEQYRNSSVIAGMTSTSTTKPVATPKTTPTPVEKILNDNNKDEETVVSDTSGTNSTHTSGRKNVPVVVTGTVQQQQQQHNQVVDLLLSHQQDSVADNNTHFSSNSSYTSSSGSSSHSSSGNSNVENVDVTVLSVTRTVTAPTIIGTSKILEQQQQQPDSMVIYDNQNHQQNDPAVVEDDIDVESTEKIQHYKSKVHTSREKGANKRALQLLNYEVTGTCIQSSLGSTIKYNDLTIKLKKAMDFEKKQKNRMMEKLICPYTSTTIPTTTSSSAVETMNNQIILTETTRQKIPVVSDHTTTTSIVVHDGTTSPTSTPQPSSSPTSTTTTTISTIPATVVETRGGKYNEKNNLICRDTESIAGMKCQNDIERENAARIKALHLLSTCDCSCLS